MFCILTGHVFEIYFIVLEGGQVDAVHSLTEVYPPRVTTVVQWAERSLSW